MESGIGATNVFLLLALALVTKFVVVGFGVGSGVVAGRRQLFLYHLLLHILRF
jgi:hypothetical protein